MVFYVGFSLYNFPFNMAVLLLLDKLGFDVISDQISDVLKD